MAHIALASTRNIAGGLDCHNDLTDLKSRRLYFGHGRAGLSDELPENPKKQPYGAAPGRS